MWSRMRPTGRSLITLAVAITSMLILAGLTQGHAQKWEMSVCADPSSLPFSHEDKTGFENRIAEILAEELSAKLTFVWWPQGATMISDKLREGDCDIIMGVPDGHKALLTTLAYYRSPYVFVYRADSPFDIQSLDDPVLHELNIGVQRTGIPPHEALLKRGLADNVVLQYGDLGVGGLGPVIEGVANEEVDVSLAWGPVAGYYAKRQPTELKIVPVTPEIEPPFLSMVTSMTIGLRPGDEALRDRLNIALAVRWKEIQGVLREYGVPLSPLPNPARLVDTSRAQDQSLVTEPIRIGIVTPTETGATAVQASLYDLVGEAARMGALLAGEDIGTRANSLGMRLDVLPTSSPSADAAFRAGERLIAVEDVSALIGGLGEGQAEALAAVSHEHKIPFFNIGSPSDALRREACTPYTFHVEASAAMYLDALIGWYTSSGHHRWFSVYEDSDEGRTLHRRAVRAIEQRQSSSEDIGSAAVVPEQPSYVAELDAIRRANADVILLLLNARDQIAFLAQQESMGLDIPTAPFPHPVTQTRDYFAAVQYQAEGTSSSYRAVLWETTLDTDEAGELNNRFISRWGQPMDPPAWAAYQSVKMLFEAIIATKASDSSALVEYLESPEAVFDIHKGPGVSFRPWDHQLRQPLYLIKIDAEAVWKYKLENKLEFADLVGELPGLYLPEVNPAERLDRLGDSSEESRCRF